MPLQCRITFGWESLFRDCFVLNHGVDFRIFKFKNMFVEFETTLKKKKLSVTLCRHLECDNISPKVNSFGLAQDVPPLVGDLGPVQPNALLLVPQLQPDQERKNIVNNISLTKLMNFHRSFLKYWLNPGKPFIALCER